MCSELDSPPSVLQTESRSGAPFGAPCADGSIDPCQHPRPSLMRCAWASLDGTWAFARSDTPDTLPDELPHEITVPFAPESPASGIGTVSDQRVAWYARTLELPAAWRGQRIVLWFGAVDWSATVWIDGRQVAHHEGGYTAFSMDITEHIQDGPVELVVRAIDDPAAMDQPRGKQDWRSEPHSIWYPRTTGIWKGVWWEARPAVHIDKLRFDADLERFALDLQLGVAGLGADRQAWNGRRVRVRLTREGETVLDDEISLSGPRTRRGLYLPDPGVDDARAEWLWTPERPVLLGVEATLLGDDGPEDVVHATTALRTIEARAGELHLNGRPRRLRLALDQGYWPDGHLTPPDASALGRDVELAKALGFDGVRKHQKIEDPRYYAWADRLGLLVWVELPSAYAFGPELLPKLTSIWHDAVAEAAPHPSVIAWVVANESWGVPDLPRSARQRALVRALVETTRVLDGTRPVVGNDGWEHEFGDLLNLHDYATDPAVLTKRYGTPEAIGRTLARHRPGGRALLLDGAEVEGLPVLLTEFGGVRVAADAPGWGYAAVPDGSALLERYQALLAAVHESALAGFCYTQLSDTFQEQNGLVTMERRPKADLQALSRATRGIGGDTPG